MAKNRRYYFLGVSTDHSMVNNAFPIWMSFLNADVELVGHNLPLNADQSEYDSFLNNLRQQSTVGSLVTSHKANLFQHCKQKFDVISDDSKLLMEISSIRYDSVRDLLIGHNTDILGCKRSLLALTIENDKWLAGDRSIVVLGAGGSGLSIICAAHRFVHNHGKLFVTEIGHARREMARTILSNSDISFVLECANSTDEIISSAGRAPLVINATGMGKDIEGSPVTNIQCFPQSSTFWELNYRGDRPLYHNLLRDCRGHGLRIEDGWGFFLDGWLNNITFALNISQDDVISDQFRNVVRHLRPC